MLELRCDRDFVELTHVALLGREEAVTRHLHGDRGTALALASGDDVRDERAADAGEINARVLIEVRVFSRENGEFHLARELLNRDIVPAFLTVFREQLTVRGPDLQRQLRLIGTEGRHVRQLGVDDGEEESEKEQAAGDTGRDHPAEPYEGAGQTALLLWCVVQIIHGSRNAGRDITQSGVLSHPVCKGTMGSFIIRGKKFLPLSGIYQGVRNHER